MGSRITVKEYLVIYLTKVKIKDFKDIEDNMIIKKNS